jgi:RNA polymerase sigma-70 factor (ECF subfamily)
MEPQLKKLIAGCCHGDLLAQRQLFDRYQSVLLVVCLRYARDRPEAQDMLQEAFLAIFRDLGQYTGLGNFEGWLRKVTVRAALQYLRRRNPLRFAEDYNELPAHTLDVHPDMEMNGEAILRLVQQLPDGYRTIFNMHCIESFSYSEIAAELGINESTVRSQYARACKQLRGMVEKLLSYPV